jgi:hypothetical protein
MHVIPNLVAAQDSLWFVDAFASVIIPVRDNTPTIGMMPSARPGSCSFNAMQGPATIRILIRCIGRDAMHHSVQHMDVGRVECCEAGNDEVGHIQTCLIVQVVDEDAGQGAELVLRSCFRGGLYRG